MSKQTAPNRHNLIASAPATWPIMATESVETRNRDLVIRIADWTRDTEEPAYDVEVYYKGNYDWGLSESFCTKSAKRTKAQAKRLATELAARRIAELL